MRRIAVALVPLTAFVIVSFGAPQERVKKKGPADFESVYASLGEAWKKQEYGRGMELVRDLTRLISIKRTEVILAALPPAPEGYAAVPDPKANEALDNPFLAQMTAGMGNVVQRKYRATQGSGEIQATVTADSPLGQMFSMWLANPALLGQDAELIKYGALSAVLKKERDSYVLQVLIDDTMVEVRVRGEDDEFLLAFFDQAAVDRLAAALRK